MNQLRTSSLFRITTVFVAMIGWFVLSNRCGLAQLAQPSPIAESTHACCAPSSEQPCHPSEDAPLAQQCCQKPHLVIPSEAKAPVASQTLLPLDVWLAWCVTVTLPSEPVQAEVILGPPPEAPAFVELVLHRSLRSHAPPRLS